jgi:hypothetical protein
MISQFQLCARCILLYAVVLGIAIGCSKERDTLPPKNKSLANQERTDDQQDTDKDSQVAKRPKHGSKEYLKNPDLFRAESKEIDRAHSSRAATQQELAELVSAMGKRRLESEELQQLEKAADKAVPLLQTALRDEKFLFHRYGKSVLDGTTLETALDLLEPFALPEASVLEPALRHPDEFFHYYALYHLARCGNDDAIDALVSGLKSPSEECRTWTLMGLEYLANSPRGSKKFRIALFQSTLPLLADKESEPAEHAPRALLALDFSRAKTVLLGDDVFSPREQIRKRDTGGA